MNRKYRVDVGDDFFIIESAYLEVDDDCCLRFYADETKEERIAFFEEWTGCMIVPNGQ